MNSKELLERTGISRATLNNYISWGLLPRPEVLPPGPQDGAAPRIGYFPDSVARRIADIQRLKKEGWSISRIAAHVAVGPAPPKGQPSGNAVTSPVARSMASRRRERGGVVGLSIENIAHPAYLVNGRFELVWFNPAAGAGVLRGVPQTLDAASHSLFEYLAHDPLADATGREQLLRFHLEIARQNGVGLSELCRALPQAEASLLGRLFDEALPQQAGLVSQAFIAAGEPGAKPVSICAIQLRQGILFVHVPAGRSPPELPPQPLQRDSVNRDGAANRPPQQSHVAVLVTDLQHPTRIWAELPAEEYFELVNQIWMTVDPIFRRHQGTHGKHPGDGMVCYFFPQPDSNHLWNALLAAHDMREAMRRVSKAWQLRKGWTAELYMNTGIDEGQEWLGTLKSADQVEFAMLGDTLNRAARISDFARFGAIWATKNLVGKLTAQEKQRLKFGVRRTTGDGREHLVSSVFTDVDSLTDPAAAANQKFKDIARLPITEIVEIAASADNRRTVEQSPD